MLLVPPPLWASAVPLEFIDSATSRASTITIPATAASGDFAVLFDFVRNSSPVPTNVVPSGWTQAVTGTQDAGSNDSRTTVSYKMLGSGDPGASIAGMDGSNVVKVMLVFTRPGAPASSLWVADNISTNPASQAVAASGVGTPLLVLGCAAAATSGAVAFSTASPAFDDVISNTGSNPGIAVGYKIYDSGGASDHTIDMNDLGDANSLSSGVIAF